MIIILLAGALLFVFGGRGCDHVRRASYWDMTTTTAKTVMKKKKMMVMMGLARVVYFVLVCNV